MEIELLAATFNSETGKFEVAKQVTKDDGTSTLVLHFFAPETLEWRAAEYGIDPADVDTLIDVVMHEQYIDEAPLWTSANREEAKERLLSKISGIKTTRPRGLARATSVARTKRLSDAGVAAKYVAAAEQDPVEFIKQNCEICPDVVQVIAEHVDRLRAAKKTRQPNTGASRAEQVRMRLTPPRRQYNV